VIDVDEVTRLWVRGRDGDREALAAAVRHTQVDVWRFLAHLDGPDDADELTQETFERAFRSLGRFRGDAAARTWLLGIAHRTWVDALRRRTRRRRLQTRIETAPAPGPGPDPGERVALDDLLGRLDADRRLAFVLTQVLGTSYEEAAAVCGVPVGTIRSRVARARRDLLAGLSGAAGERVG
jgi:RNA polymerase sigma-70 factor (ECF subfamily)